MILGKVPGIAARAPAAMTALAALASGFDRARPIIRKIAGAALPADTPGARRFLAIFRKVPAIAGRPMV
jgi:hypothetical protein